MKFLLAHGADPNSVHIAGSYYSPLCLTSKPGMADMILAAGGDINGPLYKDKGIHIIDYAITFGRTEMVKWYLDHGVDPTKVKNSNPTLLFNAEMISALQNRRTTIVKLFWEHGNRSVSELSYAISQGRPVDEIAKLLDGGIPVDPPQDAGFRPITQAAELGRLDVVKLLVERGAKIGDDDKDNTFSTLNEAAWEGQDEVVTYLLQHGAKAGYQPLWNAVWNSHPYENQRTIDHFEKTVRLLIEAGGLKGLSEGDSAKLLAGAIFTRYPGGNQRVVQMLLDAGLSLKARDEQGKSVIDLAHEACTQNTCSTPTKEMMAFLEKADKK